MLLFQFFPSSHLGKVDEWLQGAELMLVLNHNILVGEIVKNQDLSAGIVFSGYHISYDLTCALL